MKLDELDHKIIHCLQANGRLSYKVIGERIGLTSPAVAQRMQKLEEEGVIEGYTVRLNHRKLGIGTKAVITARVGFGKFPKFAEEFEHYEEVIDFFPVTGEDCVMMFTHFRDNAHLMSFLGKVSVYGTTKTQIILDELKKSSG